MIHPRAIVITVTKTIVRGQPLLGELTTSLLEASKGWVSEKMPAYFLIRVEGRQTAIAWELGDISCDLDAIEAWVLTTPGIGRAEVVNYFDPMQPSRKSQRPRVEKKKAVSAGPLDRSLKPSDVVPALRPLLEPDGRRECDRVWCFLSDFAQKTPGDIPRMEKFISEMPEALPKIHAADQFMKGILAASMRAIVDRRPGVTMVVCSWPLDLRDGRPDFNTLRKKAKELIDFQRPTKSMPAINPDDDADAEWSSARFF